MSDLFNDALHPSGEERSAASSAPAVTFADWIFETRNGQLSVSVVVSPASNDVGIHSVVVGLSAPNAKTICLGGVTPSASASQQLTVGAVSEIYEGPGPVYGDAFARVIINGQMDVIHAKQQTFNY